MGEAEFAKQLLEPRAAGILVRLRYFEHGHDVLLDREPAEDRRFLRQITEAEDRPPVHWQFGNVLSVEKYPSGVRLHQAHHRIEACRLAGTVRSEQAHDLTAVHVERDVMKNCAPVIGLGDRPHFETTACKL